MSVTQRIVFSLGNSHGRQLTPYLLYYLPHSPIPFQSIPWWSCILVSWPMLEHLHNEFIHVLLNPHCIYLSVYIPRFRGQDALHLSHISAIETVEHPNLEGNCRKILSKSRVHNDFPPLLLTQKGAWSPLNPTSHNPTPFPSLSEFPCGQWNQATTHKKSCCYNEFWHSTVNSVAKLAFLSYPCYLDK